jgi:hypothetical protein
LGLLRNAECGDFHSLVGYWLYIQSVGGLTSEFLIRGAISQRDGCDAVSFAAARADTISALLLKLARSSMRAMFAVLVLVGAIVLEPTAAGAQTP